MAFTVFHHPRCSKSRQVLALLESRGIQYQVVEYLKEPLIKQQIADILSLLKMTPQQLMRQGETIYKGLNLKNQQYSDDEWLDMLCRYPILIERPIVFSNQVAVIARPPESVLEVI